MHNIPRRVRALERAELLCAAVPVKPSGSDVPFPRAAAAGAARGIVERPACDLPRPQAPSTTMHRGLTR
ncbi:MAG: hypothetical protein M3545_15875 [Acidobacteriota bacterium]|nr:hypothetical protein [Acidobacteriota bacterium]